MALIEGFRVRNYKALKDVTLGKLWNQQNSTIRRASDDATVSSMVQQGLPLGSLWYSDYLDSRQA